MDLSYQIHQMKPEDIPRVIQKCRTALDNSLTEIKKQREKMLEKKNDTPESIIHDLCLYNIYKAKAKFYQECIAELNDVQSQASQTIDQIQASVINFDKLVELSKVLYDDNKKMKMEDKKTRNKTKIKKSKKKKHDKKDADGTSDLDID